MELYITIAIIVAVFAAFIFYYDRKGKKENEKIVESLEDETIYVEGVGNIKFEDLPDMVNGDSEAGVKYTKDTMFREDLMQFDGEFLIEGLPLNEERRLSIDDAFLYLMELFGKDLLIEKPVLTIHDSIFPVEVNDISEVITVAHTVAKIMDIDPDSIDIQFFAGAKAVDPMAVDDKSENTSAAGLYYGKDENGKYVVDFADNIHLIPERLIATIAHEFAHIKLLGEGRMTENSEELTDMLPLFYGFGLFNSDMVLTFKRDSNGVETRWQSNSLGYLSFADWGYLFALYMYVRDEKEPVWFNHLNKTVSKDCKLALEFILANPDKVLQPINR